MARKAKNKTKAPDPVPRRKESRIPLSTAIILIVIIEAVALGIKAFDDRRRQDAAAQTVTHREALAVSELLSGKTATILQGLTLSYQAGWNVRQTAANLPEVETVANLADALSAPDGSRLHEAGSLAASLVSQDEVIGLSEAGDIVFAVKPNARQARIGLVKLEDWVPDAQGGRTFSLRPGSLEGLQTEARPQLEACSPLKQGAVSVCVSRPPLPFGQAEWLNLLSYGLLILAPALALIGLFKLLQDRSGQSELFEGQATRAGRVLETVLKEAKAGFWSWDFDRGEIWLSDEAAELLSVEASGYYPIGRLQNQVHPEYREAFGQAFGTLLDRNFVAQVFPLVDPKVWLDMRARPDPDSGEINGIVLDISERRAAMMRTKQAEQRLRSALEGFSGPFALWDKRERLIYWNRAFASVFGMEDTLRAGMGRETVRLAQAAAISERRKSLEQANSEVVRAMDGHWYKLIERKVSNGGMITMGMNVSADVENETQLIVQQKRLKRLVSELERSEGHAGVLANKLNEEKDRAEKSANSKSAFLANMSHELRTPLNAINGFSEILVTEMYGPLGDDRYKEYANDILASGQHLLDMINDILDMAKIEAGKMTIDPRPIDLVDPVDAAVRMIRRKAADKGVELTLAANDGLPLVDADHRAIRQMILNLVSNAIKFTDDGGSIRVSIDQKDEMLRVMVRDTGVGIPAEALPRLAEPFEQVSDTRDRNYEGTGLGLALTKSFAEMHGGHLTISSQEGKGTIVSFFIPVIKEGSGRSVA